MPQIHSSGRSVREDAENGRLRLTVHRVDWPYRSIFRIAYRAELCVETVMVELDDGEHIGRGEAAGVNYHGETADTLHAEIEALRPAIEEGIGRERLQHLLSAGGARNALDCALWDLAAKRAGQRAWSLAGLEAVRPLKTAFTLGLDEPPATARAAAAAARFPLLKLKLDGQDDLARVRAVRAVRPDVEIIVDANQAWTPKQLEDLVPELARLGVVLIEQPLPKDDDDALVDYQSPIAICADESCQTTASLHALQGKYSHVNIKLDKTGGLTEALRLAQVAKDLGLKLMVGCMSGSSLAMAPAFIVGQLCDVVDLDGPLLASADIDNPIRYEGGLMAAPGVALWG